MLLWIIYLYSLGFPINFQFLEKYNSGVRVFFTIIFFTLSYSDFFPFSPVFFFFDILTLIMYSCL